MLRAAIVVLVVLAAAPGFAQQGVGNECTPAGTWYGGSDIAWQMTLVPSVPAGHYTLRSEGFYKDPVMNMVMAGELVKNGDVYEGPVMYLNSSDPAVAAVGAKALPDLAVQWFSVRMEGCNTIKNSIQFFGLYFGASVWAPAAGGPTWATLKPLVDPPNLDLLNIITGGDPINEVYRRLPTTVNPALLHK